MPKKGCTLPSLQTRVSRREMKRAKTLALRGEVKRVGFQKRGGGNAALRALSPRGKPGTPAGEEGRGGGGFVGGVRCPPTRHNLAGAGNPPGACPSADSHP